MSDGIPHEHWLDRLAEGHTRRRFLKTLLAGAALTLPLARSPHAFAGAALASGCTATKGPGDHDCLLGCLTTADNRFEAAKSSCDTAALAAGVPVTAHSTALSGSALAVLLGPLGVLGALGAYAGAGFASYRATTRAYASVYQACIDNATKAAKASSYDCTQPKCPGWDPCDPFGPCNDCTAAHVNCCPCTSNATGYCCCVHCADNGDGCKALAGP